MTPPEPSGRWTALEYAQVSGAPGWSPASTCPLPWRRYCPQCHQHTEVRDAYRYDLDDALDFEAAMAYPFNQVCTRCGFVHPLHLIAQWQRRLEEPVPTIAFRLSAPGGERVVGLRRDVEDDPWLADMYWRHAELHLRERLTYRSQCAMPGCVRTGRTFYEASCPIPVRVTENGVDLRTHEMPAGQFWLCPDHALELLRDPAWARCRDLWM